MNRRVLLGSFLAVVCLATLWGVWGQRSELAALRAEQQQSLAQRAARAEGWVSHAAAEHSAASATTPPTNLAVTPELLRLRSEVTRLSERRRELAGVRAENEQLRAQVASRGTNGPGGFQLPPGYIRRGEARMVGYKTPENTLQSLLWAMHNHDLTNVLQAFVPERAEELRARVGESREATEEYFRKTKMLVGMRVVKQETDASDGSVALVIEVLPGMPPPPITFRQVNGQWKMDEALY